MNQRVLAAITGLVLCVLAAVPAYPASAAPLQPSPPPPPNVDVSRRAGNESEVAIAVNPTNPNNIVMFANIAEGVAGMFLAVIIRRRPDLEPADCRRGQRHLR